mmetsp:Transcript_35279/g.75345  ORF Transcript_35279/g.75345 Transcript_35279/m.75345 type:complete len:294 (-) Transcript_35279:35-916(-)
MSEAHGCYTPPKGRCPAGAAGLQLIMDAHGALERSIFATQALQLGIASSTGSTSHTAHAAHAAHTHGCRLLGELRRVETLPLHRRHHRLCLRLECRILHQLLHLRHGVWVAEHAHRLLEHVWIAERLLHVRKAELSVVHQSCFVFLDVLQLPGARLLRSARCQTRRCCRRTWHWVAIRIQETARLRLGFQLGNLGLGSGHVLWVFHHLLRLRHHLRVIFHRGKQFLHLSGVLAQLRPPLHRHIDVARTHASTSTSIALHIASAELSGSRHDKCECERECQAEGAHGDGGGTSG